MLKTRSSTIAMEPCHPRWNELRMNNRMTPVEVRSELVNALRLDLVGPGEWLGSPDEVLPQAPSRWYLTGFLVPLDADASQKSDPDSAEEVDAADDAGG